MRHGDKCCVAVATGGKGGSSEMRVKTIDLCVCVCNHVQLLCIVNTVVLMFNLYLCCALIGSVLR